MTEVQLKEFLLALIQEADRRYEQRFELQDKAVTAALSAAKEAVSIAADNADKWRANANEWRTAMDDRERQFLSKGMGYVVGALSTVSLILTIAQRFH